MIGIVFIFITSVSWAAFDATRKSLAKTVRPLPLAAAVILGQAPLFVVWQAIGQTPFQPVAAYFQPAVASSLLNIFANFLFLLALRQSPLSLTIPFLSFTPVFAALIEWVAFGDSLVATQWLGIAIVVGGGFTLQISSYDGRASVWRALTHEKGSLYVLLVALIWSCTSVLDKMAVEHAPEAVHGIFQTATVGLGLVALTFLRRQQSDWRGLLARRWTYTGAVVAALLALGFQLLAYSHALVSMIEATKRAIGLTSALVVGKLVFDEEIDLWKIAACLTLFGGVALVLFTGTG
jgi:drug/metabolite transporter (DMT)-like permease